MILPVTLVIAAAAGLINIWLAVRVTRVRSAKNVWLGDGGSEPGSRELALTPISQNTRRSC